MAKSSKDITTKIIRDRYGIPLRPRIRTGFPSLDLHLGGGFSADSINTLTGMSQTGKSTLAMAIGYNIAMEQGRKFAYIDAEDAIDEAIHLKHPKISKSMKMRVVTPDEYEAYLDNLIPFITRELVNTGEYGAIVVDTVAKIPTLAISESTSKDAADNKFGGAAMMWSNFHKVITSEMYGKAMVVILVNHLSETVFSSSNAAKYASQDNSQSWNIGGKWWHLQAGKSHRDYSQEVWLTQKMERAGDIRMQVIKPLKSRRGGVHKPPMSLYLRAQGGQINYDPTLEIPEIAARLGVFVDKNGSPAKGGAIRFWHDERLGAKDTEVAGWLESHQDAIPTIMQEIYVKIGEVAITAQTADEEVSDWSSDYDDISVNIDITS